MPKKNLNPLPCSVCKKELKKLWPAQENIDDYRKPQKANTFETHGTYGSEYFDPLDGSSIYLNICDFCLENLVKEGLAVNSKIK